MKTDQKALLDDFVRHLEIERRASPHTASNYRRDVDALADWCKQNDLERWCDVDSDHIRVWAASCFRRGLGSRSIQRRLSAVRSFYRFLLREQRVERNPVDAISAPRAKKRLPGNLDADSMARLLDIRGSGAIVDRDRAMLELLYSSGLRLAELTDLDLGAVDFGDATVHVTGKGSKERIVPVGRKALDALRRWLASRGQLAAPGEMAMFVSNRGTRIGKRSVQARVKHWARKQGIDARVYPHLFRHSFATHVLESSHDLRGVQELLGHANIATTQVYTHLDFQHLARIYDKAHPRAKAKSRD